MSFELTGKVKEIYEPQTFSSGFVKREFVVTTQEQYPQDIKFELVKDKTALIDNTAIGDELKVSFNVRGSEWQGKYFVNLQAWKIESLSKSASGSASVASQEPQYQMENPAPSYQQAPPIEDDLPF